MFKIAFAEDKKILEAIQKQMDTHQSKEFVHIGIDKGSISFRKKIKELIKLESKPKL